MQLYLPRGFLDESKATISELAISGPLFWQLKRYHAEAWWVYWRLGRWSVEVARQGFHGATPYAETIDSLLEIVDGASELLSRYPADKDMLKQFPDAVQLLEIANSAKIKPVFASRHCTGYATVHYALSRLTFSLGNAANTIDAYRNAHPLPFRLLKTFDKSGDSLATDTAYEILDSTGTVIKVVDRPSDVEEKLSTWMTMEYPAWRGMLHRESKNIVRVLGKGFISNPKSNGKISGFRINTRIDFPDFELRLINEFNRTLAFLIQNPCLVKQSAPDELRTTEGLLPTNDIVDTQGLDGLVAIADIEPLTMYSYSTVADRSKQWGNKRFEGEGRARHGWLYSTIRPILCEQFCGSEFPERWDDAMAKSQARRQADNRDDTCRGSKKPSTQKGKSH